MTRFFKSLAVTAMAAIVYYVSAKLGLMLAFVHPSATAVWPPTGLTLAAFLVLGYRVWPGIFLGAFLVNLTTAGSIATSIGIGMGNTLEGLVGAFLVNRFANGRNVFDRPQDIFRFVVLAGMISTTISATFGVTTLSLRGFADWADYGPIWLTWWLGDAAGDLIVAPLLILWSTRLHPRWAWGRVLEMAVLLLTLFLIGQTVFGGLLPLKMRNYPLEFVCIPPLVWAAFRFGRREAAAAIFILSGLAILGTLRGFGPFVRETPNESLLLLQVFMGVIAVMINAMAAIVSERKRAEEALRMSERRLAGALDIAEAAVVSVDETQRIVLFDSSAEKIFGYAAQEVLGRSLELLLPSRFTADHRQHVRDFSSGDVAARRMGERREVYGLRKDGTEFPAEAAIFKLNQAGSTTFTAVLRDITEWKARTAALQHQAMHDVLTGLPNRILLQDRLRQAILAGSREGQPLTLFILDLDRFKEVNDTLGHPAGDLLLQQIGQRLQRAMRESDTVARLGGDEFSVVLPNVGLEGAVMTAQKILDLLETPFSLGEGTLDVGVSIGISLFPEHGKDSDTLMRHADTAMYRAKQAGHGYVVYTSEDEKQSHRRLMLVSELRDAIKQEGLFLHYQPKVDLQTGRVAGVEALVRWQHPKDGLLLPAQFIPVAERSGLFKPLTLWVLKAALRQCHAWRQIGLEIPIAVNLSVRNLYDPEFPHQIAGSLKIYHVEPHLLELEIPERIAMADTARALELLARLNQVGVGLCIDDIGAGFSSLGRFKKLPVAEIKIDKSLIMEMIVDEKIAVIVRSAIELGHNLGLKVVAKGVENRETRDRLAELGCDTAQGDYMCRPLPASELTRWLSGLSG